tara:strand:- start:232 stop:516 length:285 start_codon:yes stop_codon:yes gene_type:complete
MSKHRYEHHYAIFISSIVLFFFSLTLYVKIKNDCRELTHENFSLEEEVDGYGSQVKVNLSEINNLISRKRIEKIAQSEFNLVVAEPESIIVILN